MPNGGNPPSCWFCQWAIRPDNFLQPIHCQRHDFDVNIPTHAFCTSLSNKKIPGLAGFVAKEDFDSTMMYQWIEVYHKGYYHEAVAVASLEEFGKWSLEDQLRSIQSLNRRKADGLRQQDNELDVPE